MPIVENGNILFRSVFRVEKKLPWATTVNIFAYCLSVLLSYLFKKYSSVCNFASCLFFIFTFHRGPCPTY